MQPNQDTPRQSPDAHDLRRTLRVRQADRFEILAAASEAEDVVQEAMVRLWRVAPDWREGEAKVTTWLYRVVANLCIDRLRKRSTVPLDDVDEPMDEALSAFDLVQQRARTDALQAALLSNAGWGT